MFTVIDASHERASEPPVAYEDVYHWLGRVRSMTRHVQVGIGSDAIDRFANAAARQGAFKVEVHAMPREHTVVVYADGRVIWGAPCFRLPLEAQMIVTELEDLIQEVRRRVITPSPELVGITRSSRTGAPTSTGSGPIMTPPRNATDEAAMLELGERLARVVIERILDAGGEPDLARIAVLVAHQLMLMGQVLSSDAGLDFVVVYREELERAGRWHDQIAAMMDARGQA